MCSHTSAEIGPFQIGFRSHGVQTPTAYNPKFRAWVAGTSKIKGPHVADCDTFSEAMSKAREMFIAHHVVWC